MSVQFNRQESWLRIDDLGTVVTLGPGSNPFHDGYDFVDFPVSVSAEGLTASTLVRSVEGPGPMALRRFMADPASEWKGLPDQRAWESIEHDLTIEARSDPTGHLILTFILRESHQVDAWSVRVSLRVEPGEEMAQVAAGVSQLLGNAD